MLLSILSLLALLALLVAATLAPVADADPNANALTDLMPTPSINDKTPSIAARAPLKEVTQNLDVNDPGPGGHHEKGGPKEKSGIEKGAIAAAKICVVM